MTAPRFTRRSALLLGALLLLAITLKGRYHADFAAREPLADAPYGDSLIYLQEVERHFRGGAGGPFYKPPLYTAVLHHLDADSATGRARVRLLQALLSLLMLVMVFLLARARAGDGAGALAFLLLLLYAPLALQETKLLDTVPALFLVVAACWLLDHALARGARAGPLLLAGVLLGLAALARPANLLLAPAFVLLLAPLRGKRALAWCAGAALPVLLVAVHNHRMGASGLVPVNYSEGHTFLTGNHAQARGMYALPPGYPDGVVNERLVERDLAARALGRAPSAAEQRDHSYRVALGYLRAHPDRLPGLVLDKLRFALSSYEVDDNYSLRRERERFGLLRAFRVPFALLLALGVAAFALGGWTRGALIGAPIALTFGLLLVFYVASRYRVPAAPFLAVAGGVGVVLFARASMRRRLLTGVVAVALLALSFGVSLPYPRAQLERSQAWFDVILDMHASARFAASGHVDRAAAVLAQAIAQRPQRAPVLEQRLAQLLATMDADTRANAAATARDALHASATVRAIFDG